MALAMAYKCLFTGKSEVLRCNPKFEQSGHLASLGSLV